MTRRDLLKQMLEDRRQRHGEDAFSTQMLKRQLEDMERAKRAAPSAHQQFMIGSVARNQAEARLIL
jgi:hypothetical protein